MCQKQCLFVQPLATGSSSCCSHTTTFISEKESIMHSQHPLDLCSVVFTLYMHSVTDMTNLLELVTGQRYLMMSCREF